MNWELISELSERSLDLIRDGSISFTAKGRTFNVVVIDLTDESQSGEFVDLYNDGDVIIRATPYWEGMELPINIFTDDGLIDYESVYPLSDFSKSDDETFKNYLIANFTNAIENIPDEIFNSLVK